MPPIIDCHLDLAMNALAYDRDQTWPIDRIRNREQPPPAATDDRGTATVCLPELRRANIPLFVGTLFVRSRTNEKLQDCLKRSDSHFASTSIAHAAAVAQLAYYQLLARQNHINIITNAASLDQHWSQWSDPTPTTTNKTTPIGTILTIEGGDPVIEPSHIHWWFSQGVRALSLAHIGPSIYAAGTPSPDPAAPERDGPLTPLGIELLKHMADLHMALDLSHLADASFFQALDAFTGPVFASHTNCRALAPTPRQFTDQQLKLIIERDGVIGVVLHNAMIRCVDNAVPPRDSVSLEHLADHIDHICQLAGNTRHAAIGSDLDGGFGAEHCPRDLDSIADLQKLAPILAARNYKDADVHAILHANALRFWRSVLK